MKKLLLVSLILCANLQAHRPAINYALIDQWCKTIQPLNQSSLETIRTYLEDVYTYAQCCIQDPHCLETSEGKKIQKKIDADVTNILRNRELIPTYHHLTSVIKEEIGLEKFFLAQHKKEYILLALVIKGCLDCVERKLT